MQRREKGKEEEEEGKIQGRRVRGGKKTRKKEEEGKIQGRRGRGGKKAR